jgi:citrate/tricarballylate utilization protein
LSQLLELVAESQRQLSVCNACRYCEGYCAVFPALERRTSFETGDVILLANLCHDCRACYQACVYTAPHEFAIDIPALMSEVRAETYQRYAWPRRMAWALRRNARLAAVGSVLSVGLVVLTILLTAGPGAFFAAHRGPGAFYRLVPWLAMTIPALAATAFFAAVVWGGMIAFWRETAGGGGG